MNLPWAVVQNILFMEFVKTPWNKDYVPGGSSGGAAAGQSLGLAGASIGTDTGGSIRQPASFCGVVGLKPTYGRVSRYGVIAFASSLDQAGPITHCVEDAALLLSIMGGKDPKDMTSSSQGLEDVSALAKTFEEKESELGLGSGLKSGFESLSWAFLKLSQEINPCVQRVYDEAIKCLSSEAGLSFNSFAFHHLDLVVPVYYIICCSEASTNLARYDGIRYGWRSEEPFKDLEAFYSNNRGEGFGKEVKRRILLGTYTLSKGYYQDFYKRACQVRRLLYQEAQRLFEKTDVLLMPVNAQPPFRLGEKLSEPWECIWGMNSLL